MKQIKYFCDICGEEQNPKGEMNCIAVEMDYVHSWQEDMPLAKKLQDIRVCKKCGEHLNFVIKDAIERKGFIVP